MGDKKPNYEKAIQLHFLGEEPDYKETLELNQQELSKVKLITGSIRKGTNHQDIAVQYPGRKVSVSK